MTEFNRSEKQVNFNDNEIYSNIRDFEDGEFHSIVTNPVRNIIKTFPDFDRNCELDLLGFPKDECIIKFLSERYRGRNSNTILVAPRCSGKTHVFSSLDHSFIDEETIMKLKWPLDDDCFKDPALKKAWKAACTNVLIAAVEADLPVAMSVSMYTRILCHIDSRLLFKVGYCKDIDSMETNIKLRSMERNIPMSQLLDKVLDDIRIMGRLTFHYKLSEIEDLDRFITYPSSDIVRRWKILSKMGFVKTSSDQSAIELDPASFDWSERIFPHAFVYLASEINLNSEGSLDWDDIRAYREKYLIDVGEITFVADAYHIAMIENNSLT